MNEKGRASRRRFLGGMAVGLWAALCPIRSIATQEEFRALPKALWVWLKSLQELPDLARFAMDYRFDALMLHLRENSRTALIGGAADSIGILRELKRNNCACYALAGEPQWVMESATPLSITQLLEINRRHALFDGLHLDVEPQSLPAWRQAGGRSLLMGEMADFVIRLRDKLPGDLKLQLAVHPKHALQPLGDQDFLGRIAPHVQEVALMAYRNKPARQYHAAKGAISRLEELRLPWRMGVLSNPPKEPGVSYHGLQRDVFEARMHELLGTIKSASQCRGLIFENYHSLRRLLLEAA